MPSIYPLFRIAGATLSDVIGFSDLDESPLLSLKASVGFLKSYHFFNPNAAISYVQFFDVAAAASVTLGTTVATFWVGVPANSHAELSGLDIPFANGLFIAATTTPTGLTGPVADVVGFVTVE